MSVSFTPEGGTGLSVVPIPGTLKFGDGHDDRGGGTVPNARGGVACNGEVQVLITDTVTVAAVSAIRSGVGEGKVAVGGEATAAAALVDVEISGDAVQIAKISWKGTIAAA
jgi:hypothetical protein